MNHGYVRFSPRAVDGLDVWKGFNSLIGQYIAPGSVGITLLSRGEIRDEIWLPESQLPVNQPVVFVWQHIAGRCQPEGYCPRVVEL